MASPSRWGFVAYSASALLAGHSSSLANSAAAATASDTSFYSVPSATEPVAVAGVAVDTFEAVASVAVDASVAFAVSALPLAVEEVRSGLAAA